MGHGGWATIKKAAGAAETGALGGEACRRCPSGRPVAGCKRPICLVKWAAHRSGCPVSSQARCSGSEPARPAGGQAPAAQAAEAAGLAPAGAAHEQAGELRRGEARGDAQCRASPARGPQQPGGEPASADPPARTPDEEVQVRRSGATLPRRPRPIDNLSHLHRDHVTAAQHRAARARLSRSGPRSRAPRRPHSQGAPDQPQSSVGSRVNLTAPNKDRFDRLSCAPTGYRADGWPAGKAGTWMGPIA